MYLNMINKSYYIDGVLFHNISYRGHTKEIRQEIKHSKSDDDKFHCIYFDGYDRPIIVKNSSKIEVVYSNSEA